MGSKSAVRFAAVVTALGGTVLPLASTTASPPPAGSLTTGVPMPAGWRREASPGPIQGAGSYTVALPPELATIPVKGIDSYVSEYRSKSLRLLFDFGAYGSSGVEECRRHLSSCSTATVVIDGVRTVRASYYDSDPDGELPYRISYYIPFEPPHPPSPPTMHWRISLKIWAECGSPAACDLADRIVKTIEILPRR
jgi:hypothetical protein